MTLYQNLKNEMENHRDFWNYYGINYADVIRDEKAAREFIYDYFKGGSKKYALDTWANCKNEFTKMRNVHTVNVFFIGAFLQRMIDEDIAIKSEMTSDYRFSYIWYLVCLAHDFGYVYEKYSKGYLELPGKYNYQRCYRKPIRGPKFFSRKRWYQEHSIDITYLNPPFGSRRRNLYYDYNEIHILDSNIEYNNGTIIRKPRYSESVKNNYFYYRLFEMSVLDHGIVGADEFFSKLVVNYVKEYRKMASREYVWENIYEFHNEEGLHFCAEQIKLFAYIADCIASHNIYKADVTCEQKYRDYSLNILLSDKFQSISYQDNPLLFILCVADTVEPSKKFTNYSNEDVLKRISIDYNVNENFLYVEIDEELYNSVAGQEYVSGIEGLENWCDIKVRVALKEEKDQ